MESNREFFAKNLVVILILISANLVTGEVFSQVRSTDTRTIHVKFKEQFAPRKAIAHQSINSGMSRVDDVSKKHRAISIKRVFPDGGKYEEAHRAHGLHLWYEINFNKDLQIDRALADYRSLSYFHEVEQCNEYTANWDLESPPPVLSAGTNDPYFPFQWNFSNTGQNGGTPDADINLLNAWKVETGSPNVIVAVIDGGINLNHPDLAPALWTNSDEIPGNNIDDDHNGYIDDVHGFGFGDWSSQIFPDAHATHVAGTIGAVSNNGIGVAGIAGGSGSADGVRLMSCAGFGSFRNGGFEAAMVYAADNGAVISQNSWGGGSKAIEAAIDYFISRAGYDNSESNFDKNIQTGPMAGGIVIFAAGNSNTDNTALGYPASYPKVIAVASTDHNDIKSSFSNYGSWVDISAPGSNIISTYGQDYGGLSGTSMACPHVSGVAALVASHFQGQGLTPGYVWDRIRLSAFPITGKNPSYGGLLGVGRLDAYASLNGSDAVPPAAITDLYASEIHSSSIVLDWTATGESGNTGQAASYKIYYSRNPITEVDYAGATLILNPPSPPMAGEHVRFEIKNLLPTTNYYFAIKSIDLSRNISSSSNILHVTTVAPAIPQVITTGLSEQLFTGGISTKSILVKNVGGDQLQVRLGTPDIALANVGQPTGAKGRLFAINVSKNVIDELNPKTGVVINSIPMPEPSTKVQEGLAFDGANLYYGGTSKIYKLNAQTGQIIRSFVIPDICCIAGLGWSGRYLYVSSGNRSQTLEVDPETGIISRTFDHFSTGLTFAGKRDSFFMTDTGGLEEVSISTGQIRGLRLSIGGELTGLGYSNVEGVIFVANGSSTIIAIQPDTGERLYVFPYANTTALAADEYNPGWLTNTDDVVTISPGSTSSLSVNFVATGLSGGTLTGAARMIPVNTSGTLINIPVSLTVISAPDIETIPNANFGAQFLGIPIDSVIFIENRGFANLVVSDIHSNDSRVATSLSAITLTPGQKVPITITITPGGVGIIDTSISFTSNDPDEGIFLMPVHTEVFLSPAIELSPASLATTMLTGENKTLNFTVKNTGGSVLHWDANFVGLRTQPFSQSSGGGVSPISPSGVDEFSLKASSPEALTCLSYDPQGGFIYGKSVNGYNFYRYDPIGNTWSNIGPAPGDFNGQAAYLNGKIYHGGTKLSVYTIQTNSWTTVPFPVSVESGVLTTDGQYIYAALGYTPPFSELFYRYDPAANVWLRLADLPLNMIGRYGGLSFHSGVIYAHNDSHEFAGNGNSLLAKYYIESDTWGRKEEIIGIVTSGSAIDPARRKYFVLGSPGSQRDTGIQMSIRDLTEGDWERKALPFDVRFFSGIVFVGKPGISGIYFSQGFEGTGFARYETGPAPEWISVTPPQGDLAAGATQTLNIDLNAAGLDGGTYTRNIRVSSAHPPLEEILPLTVTVVGAPEISLNTTTIDLQDVAITRGAGASLIIKNTGTATLVVSSVTTDHPEFSISKNSFSVPTGEIIYLEVYFRPTTTGLQTGIFTFHNNDPDEGSIQLIVKADAINPIPGITPTSPLTVSLFSGSVSVHNFTVSNTGTGTMDYAVDSEYITRWIKEAYSGYLPAGETKTVAMTIDASDKSAGTYTGNIRLWYQGEIQVEIPVTMIVTDAPGIFTSRKSLNYGDRFINYQYDSTIQIRNNGVQPLSITNINVDNSAFKIFIEQQPFDLAPGESKTATIRFNPTTIGARSGHVTITSNDPDDGTFIIPLDGNGIGLPAVTLNPGQLTASALTNEVLTQSLILNNAGASVLKWKIIGQSNPRPLSTGSNETPIIPLTAGDFTSLGPGPDQLTSLTINPATGLLYAMGNDRQAIFEYNPATRQWINRVSASLPGTYSYASGGAVFLNSKMYSVYTRNSLKIGVYDPVLRDLSSIPNNLGVGTGTITTDGKLLYVAGGGNFKSLDPKNKTWTDLPIPTINLDGAGGLSYFDGVIYAHEGSGHGFAKYTVATGTWENLVPLPDKAVLGSAIDPVRKRYYAYGKNGSNFLYEYDIAANIWTVLNFTLFDVSSGGMVYVPNSGFEGIYFTQGILGKGFARYEPKSELSWLRISPLAGEIQPSESQTLGINFNAYLLNTGVYKGTIRVTSNNPNDPIKDIPVTFNVTYNGPVAGVPLELTARYELSKSYTTQLKIENRGQSQLQWNFPNSLPTGLSVSNSSGIVPGSGSASISLTFDPALYKKDDLDYLLKLSSNDLFSPEKTTRLNFKANHPPEVTLPIADQPISFGHHQISIRGVFSDPDNDALSFTAISGDPSVASVSVIGENLDFQSTKGGSSLITVKATDILNLSKSMTFTVKVTQPPAATVTGVEEIPFGKDLKASPNPFAKDITIRYHTEHPGLAIVFVYDISGKIVWQSDHFNEIKGRNEVEIDGRTLSPGIYSCNLLRNNQAISTIRIVRN